MLGLFKRDIDNREILSPPGWDYIRRTYRKEYDKLKLYYYLNTKRIKNNHILVRLLVTAMTRDDLTDDEFMMYMDDKQYQLASIFGIAADTNYGTIHNGNFFKDTDEVLILDTSETMTYLVNDTSWEDMIPVYVLYHSNTDTSYPYLDGDSITSDYTCIAININILTFQYRKWYKQQMLVEEDASPNEFISRFVIPRMMSSYTDISIVNRAIHLRYDMFAENDGYDHPVPVSNYTTRINRILTTQLKKLEHRPSSYEDILKQIPVIHNKDAFETLYLPQTAFTQQVWWALFLSRLPYMVYLIDHYPKSIKMNRKWINRLKVALYNTTNTNTLDRRLEEFSTDASTSIDYYMTVLRTLLYS